MAELKISTGSTIFGLVMFVLGATTVVAINHFTNAQKIESTKFESLHRSLVAISSATDVGVSLTQFLSLLQTLQAEASMAAEKVRTEPERRLLEKYSEIVEIYKNSYTVWRADIEAHGYSTGIADLPEHMVPLKNYQGQTIPSGLVAQIAKEYNLKIIPITVQGHSIETITVASVWEAAQKKITAIQR